MDFPTFVVEMSKAWAWPFTVFVLCFLAVTKWLSKVRRS
jgi:lipopolysaccharide export LptBFGC system permease protein LptF